MIVVFASDVFAFSLWQEMASRTECNNNVGWSQFEAWWQFREVLVSGLKVCPVIYYLKMNNSHLQCMTWSLNNLVCALKRIHGLDSHINSCGGRRLM